MGLDDLGMPCLWVRIVEGGSQPHPTALPSWVSKCPVNWFVALDFFEDATTLSGPSGGGSC